MHSPPIHKPRLQGDSPLLRGNFPIRVAPLASLRRTKPPPGSTIEVGTRHPPRAFPAPLSSEMETFSESIFRI